MSITQAFVSQAKLAFLTGSHTPLHTYKIALYQPQATLDATTTQYIATQEVTGSGYTGGGQVLATYASGLTGTTGWLDWTVDPSWAASTFTAGGALIWNTSGSQSLAVLNFGASYTATNGTFTVTFPAQGASAIITIA